MITQAIIIETRVQGKWQTITNNFRRNTKIGFVKQGRGIYFLLESIKRTVTEYNTMIIRGR